MKRLPFVLLLLLLSACTTTEIVKHTPEGQEVFRASNTSIGWDRENVSLDLLKTKDQTALQVGIGKSGGSKGMEKAISGIQEGLDSLKALRP